MKRIVAMMLTAMMLLSCTVFAVGAAETNDKIIVTECDLGTGWSGVLLDAVDGESCVSKVVSGDISSVGGLGITYKSEKSWDISSMTHLTMDLYVSDANVFNGIGFCLELTSYGTYDKQEISVTGMAASIFGLLKDGWNKVKIPLAAITVKNNDEGPFDPTAWNFMRIFNSAAFSTGANDLKIAFDNLGFEKSDASEEVEADPDAAAKDAEEMTKTNVSVPLFGCNSAWGGWMIDTEEKVAGSASLSYIMNSAMTARMVLPEAVDATGMDTLEMEIYFSDLEIMNIDFGEATFEMSSSGVPDGAELYVFFSRIFESIDEPTVGWNHVAIPLSKMSKSDIAKKGDFDISHINHIGIYWTRCAAPKANMIMKIDNIRLTNAAAAIEEGEAKAVQEVIDAIQALKGLKKDQINADNHETISAQVKEARAAYDALSTTGKATADSSACAVLLSSAERALLSYERALEDAQKPQDSSKDDPKDDPSKDVPSDDKTPADSASDNTMTLIIVIVVVTLVIVAAIAVICVIVLKKKQ